MTSNLWLCLQGVLRMKAKTVRGITAAIKRHLQWDEGKQPFGSRVMCRGITGSKLHTWPGLVGYCCKDMHEQHFQVCLYAKRCWVQLLCLLIAWSPELVAAVLQCVMHNISQEDVEEGQVQYVMYGKDLKKNRCDGLVTVQFSLQGGSCGGPVHQDAVVAGAL